MEIASTIAQCSADKEAVNTSSSSHQVDSRSSLLVSVSVLSQVRNGDGGWFIEGSLRWLQTYNGTHDRQRRLRSQGLSNHLFRHRQNLCTNKQIMTELIYDLRHMVAWRGLAVNMLRQ